MTLANRSTLHRYGVVPLAIALATLPRWPFWSVLEGELAFLFLWPAVMFCAWYGGLGPGLLATLVSALAAAFFILEPRFSFEVATSTDMVGIAVFITLGSFISALSGRLHRSQQETDRHAKEVARQREWLRGSLASIGDAVIATDTEGKISFLNAAAASLTGWRSEEAQGRPLEAVFVIINEETRTPVEHPVAKVLREGHVVGLANHTVMVAKDGRELPIEDSAAPIKADDGSIMGVILVFHDDTARRRSERAVRESEARKAAILATALDGIISIDHEGRLIEFNPAAEQMFGYRREDVERRPMADLIIPESFRKAHFEGLARYVATGESRVLNKRMELSAVAADGRQFPVELAITRIPTEGPPIFTGYVRDITERKRAQEELRRASQSKDEFLAMLAHELRNPLAPISNGLQIMKSSWADVGAVEKARNMMERQITHMTRIVNDLLDASRLATGKFTIETERLDLARLTRITVEDHRALLEKGGLTVETHVPELPVWVTGDAIRLTQVLGNLLQNAEKFSQPGGSVTVRLSADKGQGKATISVLDTGIGIESEMLPRLFETFTQADRSLDRSKGGLGLGLSLAKKLTELHGGDVHVISHGSGHGSEFVVRVPLDPEPPAITQMPAALSRLQKQLRILVVEDNRDSAETLRLLLKLYGCDVTVAYTGPEGVEAAKSCKPDIILCDIGLPGLDGYGVVRALRRNASTAQAQMIAVTGYGGAADRQQAKEAGFDLHLTKPVEPAILQEVVASYGSN